MRSYSYSLLMSGAIALVSLPAFADDFKVYSPHVEQGELSAEANLNYSHDHRADQNKYFSQVLGFDYGVTKYWQTEVSGEFEKFSGDNNKMNNLKWENVISPWAAGENFIDTGLYIELEKSMHKADPNNFEAKLLLEKDINKFANTANLKVEHNFGAHSENGWGSGMALQSRYRYDQTFEPGIEYYANFGRFNDHQSYSEQDHRAGPVISGKIDHVKYEAGALFGVSNAAADQTYKLNMEYEF